MVFEISPIPDSPWITLFVNNWEMERSKYLPPEFDAIDFNFDANNPAGPFEFGPRSD